MTEQIVQTETIQIPKLPLLANEIKEYLPHRYPFLLVDRVVETDGQSILGYKNVTVNEEFFQGHFPSQPIMPGVLIIEAMAQISGILGFIRNNVKPDGNSLFLFAGVEKVRFKRPVVPGDRLVLKSETLMQRASIYKYSCSAFVDNQLVASAEITISHQKMSNNES